MERWKKKGTEGVSNKMRTKGDREKGRKNIIMYQSTSAHAPRYSYPQISIDQNIIRCKGSDNF